MRTVTSSSKARQTCIPYPRPALTTHKKFLVARQHSFSVAGRRDVRFISPNRRIVDDLLQLIKRLLVIISTDSKLISSDRDASRFAATGF